MRKFRRSKVLRRRASPLSVVGASSHWVEVALAFQSENAALGREPDRDGVVSKIRVSRKGIRSGGLSFSRGALYELLSNPIYIGEIRHKRERHPGQHERSWNVDSGRKFSGTCRIASLGGPSLEPKCPRVPLLEGSSTKPASRSMSRPR